MEDILAELKEMYPQYLSSLNVEEWLADDKNFSIFSENGVGLFEQGTDGIYSGHYFFKVRGREALDLAREMINLFFEETGAKAVRGFTPVDHRGARWLSRQVGFTSFGEINVNGDVCELFVLTRPVWEKWR